MKKIFVPLFLIFYCSIFAIENERLIFFLGASGSGKTTLMSQLSSQNEMFYMPKITVTRLQRFDDDPLLFEYVSSDDYLQSRRNGEFLVDMGSENNFYGYKIKHLNQPEKYALLYGSPLFVDILKEIKNSLFVLIETDYSTDVLRKEDPLWMQEERKKINSQLSQKFYNNQDFRQKMDLIFCNRFGDVSASSRKFREKIYEMQKKHPF